jgi:hypothetical protein
VAGITYPVRLASIEAYVRQVNGGAHRYLTTAELDVIHHYADLMLEDIIAAWPVDTATSSDAWTYEVTDTPGFVGFTIENDVEYVEWVHYAGMPAEPALWETLLPATVGAYAGQMLAELRTTIDREQARINANKRGGGRGWADILFGRRRGGSNAA